MNLEEIRNVVARHDPSLTAEVAVDPSSEGGVFITLQVSRDAHGRRNPSGKALADLAAAVEAAGSAVRFLLLDKSSQEAEDGLRASLLSSFPRLVRNSYLTVEDGLAHVWIEKKTELDPDQIEKIAHHVRTYAHLFNLRGAKLNITSDFSVATSTEVLRIVRKLAPATCESVCKELEANGYSVPSLQWVNHRFDALRKSGLLVRMPDQTYALTWDALHRLGTIKSRRSPDITRLLALSRRGT